MPYLCHQRNHKAHHEKGFTLIELMVTLAVLGILALVAYPSMDSAIRSNALSSTTNRLVAVMQYARGQAIQRRTRIKVCPPNANRNGCGTDLEGGIFVFANSTPVKLFGAPHKTVSITQNSKPNFLVTIEPDGSVANPSPVTLTDSSERDRHKTITITAGGLALLN